MSEQLRVSEQDTIRNLAGVMVSVLQWVELQPTLHLDHIAGVKILKTRFRSIYRRPWRFKLPVMAQSAHETLEWVANYFSGKEGGQLR
jgi:hypothetical protein